MRNNRYYKVIELTDIAGRKIYRVKVAENWFRLILGLWEGYELKNKTKDEAIDQIQTIHSHHLIAEKEVYRTRTKDLTKQQ